MLISPCSSILCTREQYHFNCLCALCFLGCRCSLTYEEVIAGIKQELQSARRHRQQLQAQV